MEVVRRRRRRRRWRLMGRKQSLRGAWVGVGQTGREVSELHGRGLVEQPSDHRLPGSRGSQESLRNGC